MSGVIDRVVKHPKTTAAGLLIGLTSVLGVLEQQGVSFGHVGKGSGISLAAGLATAPLGVLARD